MRMRAILAVASVLVLAGSAPGALQVGDQFLVDVGVCWDGGTGYPGYGPVPDLDYWSGDYGAHGTPTAMISDGNYWNNYSAKNGGAFAMQTTAGAQTSVTINMNGWAVCGPGPGQVYGIDEVSNLYPSKAQTDCRWWDDIHQPGEVYLTGLDTGLEYTIKCLSYVSDDAQTDFAGAFPHGTVDFVIGTDTVTIDPENNTTTLATFANISPDGNGDITIKMYANTPDDCGVPLNVIDITVVPEPTAALLLALGGGLAAWRRRRR